MMRLALATVVLLLFSGILSSPALFPSLQSSARVLPDPLAQVLQSIFPNSTALAQRFDVNTVAPQVYEQLPDLPLENQYVSRTTGDVVTSNTLISRLVRYHIYVKGRPPIYRFDWKISLADYLGVNDLMVASDYPSADALKQNPMEGDIAAMRSLSRAQRDALVQTLTDIFRLAYYGNTAPQSPTLQSPASQSPAPGSSVPASQSPGSPAPASPAPLRDPQPGDAQLLAP